MHTHVLTTVYSFLYYIYRLSSLVLNKSWTNKWQSCKIFLKCWCDMSNLWLDDSYCFCNLGSEDLSAVHRKINLFSIVQGTPSWYSVAGILFVIALAMRELYSSPVVSAVTTKLFKVWCSMYHHLYFTSKLSFENVFTMNVMQQCAFPIKHMLFYT